VVALPCTAAEAFGPGAISMG
jgi:hypothetical protein